MRKIIYILAILISPKLFSQSDIFNFNNWGQHQTEQVNKTKVWNKKKKSESIFSFKSIKKRKKRAQRRLRFFRGSNV